MTTANRMPRGGRLVALDLGTLTGWAQRIPLPHISRDPALAGSAIVSGTQSFAPGRHDAPGRRFLAFRNWLTDEFGGDYPSAIYYEDAIRFLSIEPTRVYFGMLATLQAWAEHRSVPYIPVHVAKIKKYATGKGNAQKPAMIAAAKARFVRKRMDDNEADALHLLGWAIDCERVK